MSDHINVPAERIEDVTVLDANEPTVEAFVTVTFKVDLKGHEFDLIGPADKARQEMMEYFAEDLENDVTAVMHAVEEADGAYDISVREATEDDI